MQNYSLKLSHITKQQEHILNFIYQFRFLSRIQIQHFLNHKYPKRINDWLTDLTNKQYLHRLYDEKTFRGNSKPAIYFANKNAIRYFKTQKHCNPQIIQKLYRESQRTQGFQEQCLLIASVATDLQQHMTKQKAFIFFTQSDIAYENSPFHFLSDFSPHLVFVKEKQKKKTYYLLEYFVATLPRFAMRKRLRAYIEFFYSNVWENNIDASFPLILIACETKQLLITVKRMAKRILEEEQLEDISICFATVADIQTQGVTSEIWEEL